MKHLSDLFWNMEHCKTATVTPELELAKLALVTSQDEEEDETDKGVHGLRSNDTDATLVDEMAPAPQPCSTAARRLPSRRAALDLHRG